MLVKCVTPDFQYILVASFMKTKVIMDCKIDFCQITHLRTQNAKYKSILNKVEHKLVWSKILCDPRTL